MAITRQRAEAQRYAVTKGYAGLDDVCERTLSSGFPHLYCLGNMFCSAWDECLGALQSGKLPALKRGTSAGLAVVIVYKSYRSKTGCGYIRKVFHSPDEAGKELERLHRRRREASAFWNDANESRFGAVVRDKTQRPVWRYYHGDQPS